MFKDYVVDLKLDSQIKTFEQFLKCHYINYEVLNDLGVFLIKKVSPMCAQSISTFSYINYVTENINVTPDEENISDVSNDEDDVPSDENDPPSTITNKPGPLKAEEEWYRENTGINFLWKKRKITGKGVKIALIDSGVEKHKALKLADSVKFLQTPSKIEDATGAGTRRAGIIAARNSTNDLKGVAYNCDLYSVRIVEDNKEVNLWSLYEALEWSIDNKMDIAAITLSIHPDSIKDKDMLSRVAESIVKASKHGVVVVSSVGAGNNPQVNIPASLDQCYSITGVRLSNLDDPSYWNLKLLGGVNVGSVDFQAPGGGVRTTAPNNKYDSGYVSTGAACAYFVGGLALVKNQGIWGDKLLPFLRKFAQNTLIPTSWGGYGFAYYLEMYDEIG